SRQPAAASLSASESTKLEIEGGNVLLETVTRAKLERLNNDPFHIDNVIILGGSTRIPNIQPLLKDFFNGTLAKQYRYSLDMKHGPFGNVDTSCHPVIEVTHKGEKKPFTPGEISAIVLGKMKKT
ncbi:ATPase with role in protein import into the ER, partial [Tulasnella sp. 417]